MRRIHGNVELPDEDELQDEVWEDESPAPAPDPEKLHPPRQEASPRLHRVRKALAYRLQWFLLQMFGPAQQDEAHDPLEQLKRKYHRK